MDLAINVLDRLIDDAMLEFIQAAVRFKGIGIKR